MRRLLLIPLLTLLGCSVFAQSRVELYNNFEVAISEQDTLQHSLLFQIGRNYSRMMQNYILFVQTIISKMPLTRVL